MRRLPPWPKKRSSLEKPFPTDAVEAILAFSIKGGTGLKFSKNVEIKIPYPSGAENKKLKVYYYDETNRTYKLAGDGGKIVEEGGKKYIVISVDHITDFVVFSEGEKEDTGTEEDEDAGSTDQILYEEVSGLTRDGVEAAISNFSDVVMSQWFAGYVAKLYVMGVIEGYDDGTYKPDKKINRAEFTKIAMVAFGHAIPESVTVNPFPDVKAEVWYAPYVAVAKNKGIVQGYGDGLFKPDDLITRPEALKILLLSAGLDIPVNYSASSISFPDINTSAWYMPYLVYAVEQGIVKGYPDGTFRPQENIRRAEVAKVAVKLIELLGL